jgi:hypothetical protein
VSGGPRLRFLPLQALAHVLTALLAVVIAAITLRLGIELLGIGSGHWQRYFIDMRLDKVVNWTDFALGVAYVVWLRRARINAERHGWQQRRASAWAFWGWIVPIVSLWIPFQIMGDIWRAGLPEDRRHKVAWLPALWWTTWLLGTAGPRGPSEDFWPELTGSTRIWTLCVLVVSGLTLLVIIRTVSRGPVGQALPEG